MLRFNDFLNPESFLKHSLRLLNNLSSYRGRFHRFFGPVKELKNQIEDTWDADTPIVPPTELIDISNSKKFSRLWTAHSGTESLWEIDANSYDIHTLGMFVYEDFLFTLNH